MRADLLALTPDDLTAFSNRGLTRRAEQEVSTGALTCEITEDPNGTVTVTWSDDVECRLPAHVRLTDSRCTCPATTLCRHILRSVFAYQRQQKGHQAGQQGSAASAGVAEPGTLSASSPAETAWNPATVTDAQLATHYSSAELARWQREVASGHVVQVWTGAKPRALLLTLGCTVNFLVPHDLRYAVCDCNAAVAPCGHVALAVWAFRRLAADAATGLISTEEQRLAAPSALLDEIERDLIALASVGVTRTATLQVDRWRRFAERARAAQLMWPAEVLHDIADLHAAYLAHDARFDPRELMALLAELVQRLDAIRTACTPVPHLFVRGSVRDREVALGSARLIGVGCSVRTTRSSTEVVAHLQDSDSGALSAVARRFPQARDSAGAIVPAKPFFELARGAAIKGTSLAAIGRGQLLIKGGRRTPSGHLLPGRAAVSVAPQAYEWETLRSPLRSTGFAAAREQLRDAPPAVLAPRQASARLTVCPVAHASEVRFDIARQEIVARLTDPLGATAWLVHPYTSRGSAGSECLLHALRSQADQVRFVCAEAQLAGNELLLRPLSVVIDEKGRRSCIQPWVDAPSATATSASPDSDMSHASVDPLQDYLEELLDCLAERWLIGPATAATAWTRLATLGTSLGLRHLADLAPCDAPQRLLEMTVAADFAYREFARLSDDEAQEF